MTGMILLKKADDETRQGGILKWNIEKRALLHKKGRKKRHEKRK